MIDSAAVYTLLFISLYFEVFMLVAFLERKFAPQTAFAIPKRLPKVAIVVPCYNEEKTVTGTLRSLVALEYPSDLLEIIVVDDGSRDGTAGAVEAFLTLLKQQKIPHPALSFYKKENGGKHTAMNLALAKTDAELIGCLDADSEVHPEALKASVVVFQNAQVAAVTPGIHPKKPKTLLQYMQQVEYNLSLFNRFMLASLGSAFITPGPFSIFRASVVKSLGGWRHGHSTEDMELALRIQQAGHLIANAPTAIVHTQTPPKVRALFRQRVRWTYGFLRNAVDYRSMFFNRSYGNLGLIILPLALISIGTGIFFFWRIVYWAATSILHIALRSIETGIYPHLDFSINILYFATSMMWFLVYMSVALMIILIIAGTMIGTDKKTPPRATPLFLMFYSFLVPMWLGAAVVRAVFRTGVQWR